MEPGMVTHACDTRTLKGEAKILQVLGQPRLYREILSQKKRA
jgi:hypothetical protein